MNKMPYPTGENQWSKRSSLITSANSYGKCRFALMTMGQWNLNRNFNGNNKCQVPSTATPRKYVIKKNALYKDVSQVDLLLATATESTHSLQDKTLLNSNKNACRQSVHEKRSSTEVAQSQHHHFSYSSSSTDSYATATGGGRSDIPWFVEFCRKLNRSPTGRDPIFEISSFESETQSMRNSNDNCVYRSDLEAITNNHSDDDKTSLVDGDDQKNGDSVSKTSRVAQSEQPHCSHSSSPNDSYRTSAGRESFEIPWFVEYCRLLNGSPSPRDTIFEISAFKSETQSMRNPNDNWIYNSGVDSHSDDNPRSLFPDIYRYSERKTSQVEQSQQLDWSHSSSNNSNGKAMTGKSSELPWFVKFCRILDTSPIHRDAIFEMSSCELHDTASWFYQANYEHRCSVPITPQSLQTQRSLCSRSSSPSGSYGTAPEQSNVKLMSRLDNTRISKIMGSSISNGCITPSGEDAPFQTLNSITVPELGEEDVVFTMNALNERIVLGKGSFGYVCLATLKGKLSEVVVKEFTSRSTGLREILHEARILLILEQTNMVPKCYGIMSSEVGPSKVAMVQECIGGGMTLQRLLHINPPYINQAGWLDICQQLATGLDAIHKKCVLLNDIKIDNILIDCDSQRMEAKFIDMGYATFKKPFRFRGSPEALEPYDYLAPEVRQCGYTSTKSDVYSLGCVYDDIVRKVGCDRLSAVLEVCKLRNPKDRPSTRTLIHLMSAILL